MATTAKPDSHRKGLRFRKLDLHTHTPASKCFADQSTTAAQIVTAALTKGLDGIAITDHNSGAWIDDVKHAAAAKGLVVFPGVEITCMGGMEGIHIIALFDPGCGRAEIESLLGNLGLKPAEYGDITTVVQRDPISVCEIIARREGLAVLAHANSSKGALEDMRGEQRTALIRSPYVTAAEGTDFRNADAEQKHRRVIDLLDGSDPTYKRKLAVYQASDNPTGQGDGKHALAGIGSRCAYFKLDNINIDGLRQCFSDPDVRIRQDYQFASITYPRIGTIKITGGFFDGAEAAFHEGLNSILGAKGAGKSLIVEFLRFALNQPPTNDEILADHESKLSVRLENYGSVEVGLVDETGRDFTVKRTYNPAEDHPYAGGEKYDLSQLFPVLFLSQNEIINIAESEAEQIAFIDRFFDFKAYQQEIADVETQLNELDSRLGDSLRAHQEGRQLEQMAATLKKEVEQLDAALKDPVFDEYSRMETKDRALREQQASLDALAKQLEGTRKTYSSIPTVTIPAPLTDDPAVKRAADIAKEARSSILARLDEAIADMASGRSKMRGEYDKWLPQFQAAKARYEETVQKGGGDYKNLAQRRAKRVKELESIDVRLGAFRQKSDQIKDLNAQRKDGLDSLKGAYERYSHERQAKCKKIEQESAGRLLVRIHESSNVNEFRNRLTSLKKGSYLKDSETDGICTKSDPGDFVRALVRHGIFRDGKALEELATKVGIDADRMRTLSEFLNGEFPVEQLLALEHQALPQDRPEIKYNVGGGTFEPLNRLSVGQKCTAMLIIALSEGTTPIVIDQPEDSLDIRSIWEDMCSKIRRGKERRQFLFTTHNSSLAVASDTDKFIILEAGATHGKVAFSGSMDHAPVSDEVMDYLEGGIDTYRTKYGKYHLDRKS